MKFAIVLVVLVLTSVGFGAAAATYWQDDLKKADRVVAMTGETVMKKPSKVYYDRIPLGDLPEGHR